MDIVNYVKELINNICKVNYERVLRILNIDNFNGTDEMFFMFYINKHIRMFVYQNGYNDNIDRDILMLAQDESDIEYWKNTTLPDILIRLENSLNKLNNIEP